MQMIPYLLTQVQVIFLGTGAMIPGVGICNGVEDFGGAYQVQTKTVYVCDIQASSTYIEPTVHNMTLVESMVLKHELGHHVDFTLITEKEKEEYKREWEKSIAMGKGQFIRSYGTVNVMEGFADDFMYITEGRYYYPRATTEKQKQIKKRTDIVRKIIKRLEVQARKAK